jgi:uncharacterized protein
MQTMAYEVIPCAVILSLAMVARSAFGFGHAAFAMPLLLLFVNPRVASPLLGTTSLAVSVYSIIKDWNDFQFGSASQLIIGALIGIPIGVASLVYLDPRLTIIVFSVLLALLAARSLFGMGLPKLSNDRLGVLFGLAGGVLGGAFNLTGIPAAVYGTMRGWEPNEFRTTLTGYLIVTALASVLGYYTAGLMNGDFAIKFVLCLLPAWLGNELGRTVSQNLDRAVFERWTWALILGSSCLLFLKALFA